MDNSKCKHCKYRHSWDCDDGLPYPDGGCENFELDKSTLTKNDKAWLELVELMKSMGGELNDETN